MATLKEKVDAWLKDGSKFSLDEILLEALSLNNNEALDQVVRLAIDNYGGETHKWYPKKTACAVTLNWGEQGIDELAEAAIKDGAYATLSTVITFLAGVACGKVHEQESILNNLDAIQTLNITAPKFSSEQIKLKAKSSLIDLIKKIEIEEQFPISIMSPLGFGWDSDVQEQIFAALIMRWFHLNSKSIEAYHELINKETVDEPQCHAFLKANPYLIEPFYAEMWSKPRFGETLVPDFLIRLNDDSYIVIEIEDPLKPILTSDGNLSFQTTHAKRQALEYRDWVVSNRLYAKEQFSNIKRPFALVVIGMEGKLNQQQKDRLFQENESTHGTLKIVGFDWIYERAKTTFENLLKYGFERK